MHQKALRKVLLIQSIEETDRLGEVIPLADRAEASRAAAREFPVTGEAATSAPLSRASESFLTLRAERLFEKLQSRSPAVHHILALAGGITWLGRVVLALALLAGLSMSALDGSRRINILAFPLIGLLAWNLLVYVVLTVSWLRSRGRQARFWSVSVYERWISGRIESLMRHSTRYNVPLSAGLRRFAGEWASLSHPILMLRAKRLMHLGAALVAAGLILGLYFRGLALRYEAGWESTFLGPRTAHMLISVLYGPAAGLSGLPYGTANDISALRWTGTGGGGEAAVWIHLIAITACLYIIVPRLLAALVTTFGLWRSSRSMPLPASSLGYARTLLIGLVSGRSGETVSVVPYAYEPRPPSLAGLEALLAATVGANLKVEVGVPVRYGDEETVPARLAAIAATWQVLLMTLASTPEVENHGAFLVAWRDWLGANARSVPLLIVIDEGPYAARMRGEAAFEQRLQDRRRLWRDFITGHGLRACFVDLMQLKPGAASETNARDDARAALWTASESA